MMIESVRLYRFASECPNQRRENYICSGDLIISDGPMRFKLRGIRLIDLGKPRPHVAMPAYRKETLEGPVFEDMFFPINLAAKDFIEDEILANYLAHSSGR